MVQESVDVSSEVQGAPRQQVGIAQNDVITADVLHVDNHQTFENKPADAQIHCGTSGRLLEHALGNNSIGSGCSMEDGCKAHEVSTRGSPSCVNGVTSIVVPLVSGTREYSKTNQQAQSGTGSPMDDVVCTQQTLIMRSRDILQPDVTDGQNTEDGELVKSEVPTPILHDDYASTGETADRLSRLKSRVAAEGEKASPGRKALSVARERASRWGSCRSLVRGTLDEDGAEGTGTAAVTPAPDTTIPGRRCFSDAGGGGDPLDWSWSDCESSVSEGVMWGPPRRPHHGHRRRGRKSAPHLIRHSRSVSLLRLARERAAYDDSDASLELADGCRGLSGRGRACLLVVLGVMQLAGGVMFCMLGPFFPIEAVSVRGASPVASGAVLGAFQLAVMVTSPLWGAYLSRLGARREYICGVLFSGLFCVVFGLVSLLPAPLFIPLCVLMRLLQGAAAAAYYTSSYAILMHYFPNSRGKVIGLMETLIGVGFMVGPLVGSALYQAGGYLAPFLTMGLLCVLMGLSITPLIPTFSDPAAPEPSHSLLSFLSVPLLLMLASLQVITSSVLSTLDAVLSLHLQQFSLAPVSVGLVFLAQAGFYVLLTPLWGAAADSLPGHAVDLLLTGYFLVGAALFLAGPAPYLPGLPTNSLGLLVSALCLLGAVMPAFVVSISLMYTTATEAGFPDNLDTYGKVSGIIEAAYAFGAFAGPVLGGVVYERAGFPWTMAAPGTACILLVCIIAIYITCRRWTVSSSHTDRSTDHSPTESTYLLTSC